MTLHIIPFEDYYIQEKTVLTCVSYEDRSNLVLKEILKSKKISRCILIKLKDLFQGKKTSLFILPPSANDDEKVRIAWEKNYLEILSSLKESNIIPSEIEGSSCDTIMLAKKINSIISNEEKVLFDVSSFPKHLLLEILRWNCDKRFTCLYARPNINREAETEFSVGTRDIGVLRGFEGEIRFNRPTLLVLILGFEGSRALTIFKHFEPSKVIALIGNSSPYLSVEDISFYLEIAKKNNFQLLSNQRVIIDEISTLDPYIFKTTLNDLISKHGDKDMNILISCLGTKPQTLGLYLYWLENKGIQIIYSIPSKRRISSEGLGSIWIYKLKELLHE